MFIMVIELFMLTYLHGRQKASQDLDQFTKAASFIWIGLPTSNSDELICKKEMPSGCRQTSYVRLLLYLKIGWVLPSTGRGSNDELINALFLDASYYDMLV